MTESTYTPPPPPTDDPPPPPTQAVAPTKPNSFARIAGVLTAPAKTFEDIARWPDILIPLIVIIVLGYLSTAVIMPRMDWEAINAANAEQMQKRQPNMSEEDIERMGRFTKTIGTVMGWVGPALALIMFLVIAGVLLLAFRLMGGEGNFKQAMAATTYSWFPLTISGIIMTIVVLARGSFDPTQAATLVKSNPAFLVDMKEHPVLFSLLSSFDVFTIWTVVLLIFGFAALSKFPRGKSAAIVITLWLVFIVIKLGFAALGAMGANA